MSSIPNPLWSLSKLFAINGMLNRQTNHKRKTKEYMPLISAMGASVPRSSSHCKTRTYIIGLEERNLPSKAA